LRRHAGEALTTVLANHRYDPDAPAPFPGDWVRLPAEGEPLAYQLFTGDLIDAARPWRHDSHKLAARLMQVYAELQTAALANGLPKGNLQVTQAQPAMDFSSANMVPENNLW
jgi:hypothetical protein